MTPECTASSGRSSSAPAALPERVVTAADEHVDAVRTPRHRPGRRDERATERLEALPPGAVPPSVPTSRGRCRGRTRRSGRAPRWWPPGRRQHTAERLPAGPSAAVPPVVEPVVRAADEDVDPVGSPRTPPRVDPDHSTDRRATPSPTTARPRTCVGASRRRIGRTRPGGWGPTTTPSGERSGSRRALPNAPLRAVAPGGPTSRQSR